MGALGLWLRKEKGSGAVREGNMEKSRRVPSCEAGSAWTVSCLCVFIQKETNSPATACK